MSLERVKQRLENILVAHEKGSCDNHEPTAKAHQLLAKSLIEDIEAIDEAISLVAEVKALRKLVNTYSRIM